MDGYNLRPFLMHTGEESVEGGMNDNLLGSNAYLGESFVPPPSIANSSSEHVDVYLARFQSTRSHENQPFTAEMPRVSQHLMHSNSTVHQQLHEAVACSLMDQKAAYKVAPGTGDLTVQNCLSGCQQHLDWGIHSSRIHDLLLTRVESAVEPPLNFEPDFLQLSWVYQNPLFRGKHNDSLPSAQWGLKHDMAAAYLHDSRNNMLEEGPFKSSASQQHRQSDLSLNDTFSVSGSCHVLRKSKYLRAAQQLLHEICNVARDAASLRSGQNTADLPLASDVEGVASNYGQLDPHSCQAHSQSTPTDPSAPSQLPTDRSCDLRMRKACLIGMVEELDRMYYQYRNQMQLVISSFEAATGIGAAVPYTALARRTISREFRRLRDAIVDHLHKVSKALGEDLSCVPILNKGETPRLRVLDQRIRHYRIVQQIGLLQQQQVWRPQRGLPDRCVSILRAWLFENFLHPYPKMSEKLMLARLTGLTRSQVSNWFINARVRLWKPMVEEIYVKENEDLELNKAAPNGASTIGSGISTDAVSCDNKYATQKDEFNSSTKTYAHDSARVEHAGGVYLEAMPTTELSKRQHSQMTLLTQYL